MTNEIIQSIGEIENVEYDDRPYYRYDGYEIRTNFQSIRLLIQNHQTCCEVWGYFWSNDDIRDFVGARLLGVKITDTILQGTRLKDEAAHESDIMFVDIETDRGVLQFVAYNNHNGYYGHEARVESTQLTASEYL